MALKAHVKFDFDAEPGTGEISINTGEILTIIRQDVGDGWWEGANSLGQTGLFPEAYVELVHSPPPTPPPSTAPPPTAPPPPPFFNPSKEQNRASYVNGTSDQKQLPTQIAFAWGDEDLFDEDWSDDESQTKIKCHPAPPQDLQQSLKVAGKPASHPIYGQMIKMAIQDLKETRSSSRAAILEYILQNYKVGDNI